VSSSALKYRATTGDENVGGSDVVLTVIEVAIGAMHGSEDVLSGIAKSRDLLMTGLGYLTLHNNRLGSCSLVHWLSGVLWYLSI
jgi:hypothetical protein